MDTHRSLLDQIDKAELSLSAYLNDSPESKHRLLSPLYAELRSGVRRERYPTARDLFWDDPQSPLEEQCLRDALAVFSLARNEA